MRFTVVGMGALVAASLVLAGCGGKSQSSIAVAATKQAMEQHKTTYTGVECTKTADEHFTCRALGSARQSYLDAWCSVSFAKGSIVAVDPSNDCHWPVVTRSHQGRTDLLTKP